MKVEKCSECGAELRLGPDRCPLCGAKPDEATTARARPSVETYQDNVRALRDELKKLRDDHASEAV